MDEEMEERGEGRTEDEFVPGGIYRWAAFAGVDWLAWVFYVHGSVVVECGTGVEEYLLVFDAACRWTEVGGGC